MAVFQYYISANPSEPAPGVGKLAEVIAENKEAAVDKITESCRHLVGWPVIWVHLLVWSRGERCGFESMRIR